MLAAHSSWARSTAREIDVARLPGPESASTQTISRWWLVRSSSTSAVFSQCPPSVT